VKPVAVVVFDILVPTLLAIPLLAVAALQLAAGRRWRRIGGADQSQSVPSRAIMAQP